MDKRTRGKTAPGRLAALDHYLLRYEESLLTRRGGVWDQAVFLDLGFGESAHTTLEALALFRTVAPALRAVGVEQAPHRVANARALAAEGAHFEQGGFAPQGRSVPVRLVRAMNVLREYPPAQVPTIHRLLGERLLPGGLLVEGSCDKHGVLLVAHLFRSTGQGLAPEGLLFHSRFVRGFAPMQFRDWLPQDLRREVRPGTQLHSFFARWTEAWQRTRHQLEPSQAFIAAAAALAREDRSVRKEPWLWEGGYLLWSRHLDSATG